MRLIVKFNLVITLAFVGGLIGNWVFHVGLGSFWSWRTWLLAIVGAIIVLGIYRLILLAVSAISIFVWAALWLTGAPEQVLALNLVGTAVEILLLLTLSGSTARIYATRTIRQEDEPALT